MTTQEKREKERLKREIEALRAIAKSNKVTTQYLSNLLLQMDQDLTFTRAQLAQIVGSARWRLLSKASAIAVKSHLSPFVTLYRKIKGQTKSPKQLHLIENVSQLPASPVLPAIYDISPYKNLQLLKDIEVVTIDEEFERGYFTKPFSMATPVWNESDGILDFLKSVQAQTCKPEELIITDGGSSDNTVQLIEEFAKTSDIAIKVIREKRVPIATGRNLAIKKARNDIIVMADAGTRLHKNYCLNLVSCFKKYKNTDLVGGVWFPITATEHTKAFIPNWQAMDWNKWLTSTRAMAIKKSLAKKIGYFPEHVFYGDDTLFGVKYRKISKKWVFNKKAITYWDAPVSRQQYEKTSRNYGKGDGENGLGEYFYSSNLVHASKSTVPETVLPVRREFLEGYIEGRMNRGQIETALRKIRGVAVFLTAIPFYENDHTLLFKRVKELLTKNYKVICVHFYPNLDTIAPKKYLDIDYTLLELYYVDDLDLKELLLRYPKKTTKITVIPQDKNPRFEVVLKTARQLRISIGKTLQS